MRYPKEKRTYCPKCKTYTDHSVSLYKKGKDSKMAQGTGVIAERNKVMVVSLSQYRKDFLKLPKSSPSN